MCFVCFCVFHSDTLWHITTHVFYVFLCFSSKQTLGHMCFMCFCVFLANRSQAITHVFYVFSCFFLIMYFMCFYVFPQKISDHNPCVSCVFVFLCALTIWLAGPGLPAGLSDFRTLAKKLKKHKYI